MSSGVCHASDLAVHPNFPCRRQGLPQDLRHHQERLEGARMTKFNSLRRSDEAIEPGGVRAENLVHQKKKGALLAKGALQEKGVLLAKDAHRENGALQASGAILQQEDGALLRQHRRLVQFSSRRLVQFSSRRLVHFSSRRLVHSCGRLVNFSRRLVLFSSRRLVNFSRRLVLFSSRRLVHIRKMAHFGQAVHFHIFSWWQAVHFRIFRWWQAVHHRIFTWRLQDQGYCKNLQQKVWRPWRSVKKQVFMKTRPS